MNHHDLDFFQSVHNFVCFACDKKIANIQHRLNSSIKVTDVLQRYADIFSTFSSVKSRSLMKIHGPKPVRISSSKLPGQKTLI